jgi:hypothetical protein
VIVVLMSVVITVVVVVLMVPVAFMQLPALPLVIVVGMVPIRPFIRRTVPASRDPPVMTPVRSPIALDPGVARTRFRPPFLIAQRRGCGTNIYSHLR